MVALEQGTEVKNGIILPMRSMKLKPLQIDASFFLFNKPRMTRVRAEKVRRIQRTKHQSKVHNHSSTHLKPQIDILASAFLNDELDIHGNSFYYSSDWFNSPLHGRYRNVVLTKGDWWGNALLIEANTQEETSWSQTGLALESSKAMGISSIPEAKGAESLVKSHTSSSLIKKEAKPGVKFNASKYRPLMEVLMYVQPIILFLSSCDSLN